jgi:predicted kinase
MIMKCIIMRGASGSGKDHWIRHNFASSIHRVSADDFFLNEAGEYNFNRDFLPAAHDYCLKLFVSLIQRGRDVVVNNTNIRLFEIAPYYRLAEVFGYAVEIVWIMRNIEECIKSNIHNVPPEVIRQMILCVDPLPPWWNVRIILNH